MDPPSQALRKVRDEVTESRAWSKLQRELLTQIRQAECQAGEGQPRTFRSLSTPEKLAAVDRAVKGVGDTPAYAKLQTKVAAAVDRHFSPLVYQPSRATQQLQATSSRSVNLRGRAGHDIFGQSQAPSSTCPLAEALSRLLQGAPHLKHSLKIALNHPLPSQLRLSAWRVLLQYPAVQKDFLATGKKMEPRNSAERETLQRCQTILNSNMAVFRDIADSTALLAMKAVMLYWKQRTSGDLLDSEFLLCLPFVYVWKEELKRCVGDDKGEVWTVFSEIAGVYVRFMEMLPPSIGSAVSRVSQGGIESKLRRYRVFVSLLS